jgi:hypothetical protein
VVGVAKQRLAEAVAVAAIRDLADELLDEVAAVREDQDAAGAGGVDEADGGDGLAGAGRVLEPETAVGAGVLGDLGDDLVVVGVVGPFVPVLRLLVLVDLLLGDRGRLVVGAGAVPALDALGLEAVPVQVRARILELGRDRGKGAGEGVNLVLVQGRAVVQRRRVLGEHALQAEQEGEVLAPAHGRVLGAFVQLLQRGIDSEPARGARQDVGRGLVREQDRFTRELLNAFDVCAG